MRQSRTTFAPQSLVVMFVCVFATLAAAQDFSAESPLAESIVSASPAIPSIPAPSDGDAGASEEIPAEDLDDAEEEESVTEEEEKGAMALTATVFAFLALAMAM